MTAGIAPLTARPAWKGLEAHHEKVRDLHLRTLFENDPKRGERLTAEAAGLLVLSRQPLPTLDRRAYAPATGVARGAYVLADAPGETPRSSSSPRAAS